ncbi:unnamed protein product [Linum tenue]|uniref:Secreted protein n=1 Tax=Linum tenue TaxID=586396 RepID=A0AAV0MB43_9ROSI|nr:unnamed protein product [Linum tenue]
MDCELKTGVLVLLGFGLLKATEKVSRGDVVWSWIKGLGWLSLVRRRFLLSQSNKVKHCVLANCSFDTYCFFVVL